MKRAYFKRKVNPSSFLKKARKPLGRTRLKVVGTSGPTVSKNEIQAILRQIVIKRDGGCFLRHFRDRITPQYAECGGYTKMGVLILQGEHLHSRSNASSFSDSRLVVCCCQRHHIFYKPQHSAEYNQLAREFIGEERARLWDRVREDRLPHKVDLKLAKIALEQELTSLNKEND